MSDATCARCGEPLPAGAKFCPNCGAPVAIEPASERRLVTVVFIDLVGSTELASHLDPERFREVLAAFHRMVTEEVEWLRGRAESFIGDAVLAVFGVPTSHDDDAVRAIRAALSVVDGRRSWDASWACRPDGGARRINTGLVAVGTAADRGIVIGGEVNIGRGSSRRPGTREVLVGSTTRELVKDAVEFGEMRMITPKEIDGEIAGWPVIRLAPRSTRSTIPFVDRRRELALLNDTFERVQERGAHTWSRCSASRGSARRARSRSSWTVWTTASTVLSGRPNRSKSRSRSGRSRRWSATRSTAATCPDRELADRLRQAAGAASERSTAAVTANLKDLMDLSPELPA